MSLKHCSDELLVAHLDAELSWLAERRVQRHLNACYLCRGRRREIEEQAVWLARAIEHDHFPGPGRLALAIEKFREWEEREAGPPSVVAPPRAAQGLRRAAALALLGVSAVFLVPPLDSPGESPRQVLTRASNAERALLADTVRQSIRIQVEQTKPHRQLRTSQLHILAARDGGRFASRWYQDGRILRHALWRTRAAEAYVYDMVAQRPEAQPFYGGDSPRDLMAMLELGSDLTRLEAGFVRWVENQKWRPVSFTGEIARFAAQDGVELTIEDIAGAAGKGARRLIARRTTRDRTAEIVLEIDGDTLRPRIQILRLRGPNLEVSMRFAVVELSRPSALADADFELHLPGGVRTRTSTKPREDHLPPGPRAAAAVPFASEEDLLSRELEVLYTLHQERVCLGEPVDVVRRAGGHIAVVGVISSPRRRDAVRRGLARFGQPEWLHVELQTVEEAIGSLDAANARRSFRVHNDVTPGSNRPIPLADVLAAYFLRNPAPQPVPLEERIRNFASEAVARSGSLLSHASALARLAERHGRNSRLNPQARGLLGEMIRDHAEAALAQQADSRAVLGPVLGAFTSGAHHTGAESSGGGTKEPLPWHVSAARVDAGTQRIHEQVLALFAVGYAEVQTAPQRSAAQLWTDWLKLDTELRALRATAGAAFLFQQPGPARTSAGVPIEISSKETSSQ